MIKKETDTMDFGWEDKKEFRKHCTLLRNGIDPLYKRTADQTICSRLMALTCYRFAPTVLLYSPIKSEVDIRPLIAHALRHGKKVALPRCESEPGVMTFRIIENLLTLDEGSYGILEPSADAPILEKELSERQTFLAVPGLAFDRNGYRLGYGKGYYDRFLNVFKGITAGITYRDLIFDRLPRGFYDQRVALVINEGGTILTNA